MIFLLDLLVIGIFAYQGEKYSLKVRMAVAVFKQADIEGHAVAMHEGKGTRLCAEFSKLPLGKHGFHIHVAGDLRGEGCAGACAHFHVGKHAPHGGPPPRKTRKSRAQRHTGDLGNIQIRKGAKKAVYNYYLPDVRPRDLWGRTLIIHADEDDLGKGSHEDSATTGHSGARIGCAIFGRMAPCTQAKKRSTRRKQRGGSSLEVIYNATNVGGFANNPSPLTPESMAKQPEIQYNIRDDGLYTLIMYDPDAVGATHGTTDTFLHLLIVNKSKDSDGDICIPYYPPTPPPNTGTHRYTFEMYKQAGRLQCHTPSRSSFDLHTFVQSNKLEKTNGEVVFEVNAA